MKLIVGLGNPGKEYEKTRHNIGFMSLDYYCKVKNIKFENKKFNGIYAEKVINGEKIIFLKPQSYINLSGEVIIKFINYFKIDKNDVLIISDDLDLKIGVYKLKPKGSAGGHNGLKNIEFNLKTQEYKRLKIGIANDKTIETKDYVLGEIKKENLEIYNKIFEITNKIIDDFVIMNFDLLMNKYNHK